MTTTGDEAGLSATVDTLRGSTDAADDEHVVLGTIFQKYTFDAFEALLVAVLAHWLDAAAKRKPSRCCRMSCARTSRRKRTGQQSACTAGLGFPGRALREVHPTGSLRFRRAGDRCTARVQR